MIEYIGVLARLLAEFFRGALAPAADLLAGLAAAFAELAPSTLATDAGALMLATTVLATLALLAVAIALSASPARLVATAPHPRRAIADPTRLTESHPDAPGHSRPRAPGRAALAA